MLPFKYGFLITIKSAIQIIKELIPIFKFISFNRFNQNCLENLFALIRSKGGLREHPTSTQFMSAFKNSLFCMKDCNMKRNRISDGDANIHVFTIIPVPNRKFPLNIIKQS